MITFLKRKENFWVYLIILFCLGALVGDGLNGRLQMFDFEVYFRTASRMLKGLELYRVKGDGHFVYKYSPSAALFFIPFALLPYGIAKICYWLFLSFALVKGVQLLLKYIGVSLSIKQNLWFGIIGFLSILPHLHKDLHLGQVNILLLLSYVLIMVSYANQKWWLMGFLIAVSVLIKPFGLIFLALLLLVLFFTDQKKAWKAMLSFVLSVAFLFILPMLFYPNVQEFSYLNLAWFKELSIEMGNKQDLLAKRNHTIFSVLYRYSPLQYLGIEETGKKFYQLIVLLFMGLTYLYGIFIQKQNKPLEVFAPLILFIPLLAFTNDNAFLFSLPLTMVLLPRYFSLGRLSRILFIVALIIMGGNMHDLVGKSMHEILQDYSIYTFGALILLGVFYEGRKVEKV